MPSVIRRKKVTTRHLFSGFRPQSTTSVACYYAKGSHPFGFKATSALCAIKRRLIGCHLIKRPHTVSESNPEVIICLCFIGNWSGTPTEIPVSCMVKTLFPLNAASARVNTWSYAADWLSFVELGLEPHENSETLFFELFNEFPAKIEATRAHVPRTTTNQCFAILLTVFALRYFQTTGGNSDRRSSAFDD